MMDLDRELWRLGIPAKTRHNEVAPGQFEMAPVYEPTSVGSDHNMVVMSLMRRLAPQHGLMFLIHEKPFAGINGSGKHNNWSMATDDGENLLDPGNDPHANAQFLAFLVAVIRGGQRPRRPDPREHRRCRQRPSPRRQRGAAGDRLDLPRRRSSRTSSSSSSRAPAAASKKGGAVELGVTSLPVLPKDATDRNRTSPFAFTGNKFEFRAVGSSAPDLLAADRPEHGRRRLAQAARRRARQARPRRLRGPDRDPVGHRQGQQAGPVRGQRLLRGVARRGREARPAEQQDDGRCAAGADDRPRPRSCSRASASCPSGSWPRASRSTGSATSRSSNIEASCAHRHRHDDDPAGRGRGTSGELNQAPSSKGINAICQKVSGLADSLVDADRHAAACPARGPRSGLRQGGGTAFATVVIPAQARLREVVDELETLVADDLWPLPKYRELLFQY